MSSYAIKALTNFYDVSSFESFFNVIKHGQYLEKLSQKVYGATTFGSSLATQLTSAVGIANFASLGLSLKKYYNERSVEGYRIKSATAEIVAGSKIASASIKCIQFAHKALSVSFLSSYSTYLAVAKDVSDIFSASYSIIMKSSDVFNNTAIDKKVDATADISMAVSSIAMASLDLAAQTFKVVTGADKVIFGALTVINVAGLVKAAVKAETSEKIKKD